MTLSRIKELLLSNRSLKQTVFKNAFWLSVSTISGRFIRAGVAIYAARILGAEGYGVFSYAMSLAALFSIFSDMGLSGLLTREISKNPEKREAYISTLAVIKAIILIATLLVTILVAPFCITISEVNPLIPFAAFLVLFDSLRAFGFGFARAKNKMEVEGIFAFVTDFVITAASIAILFIKPSPLNLSVAYTIGSAIGTICVFAALRKYFREFVSRPDKKLIKPILSVAIPFAIMGIFSALMINIDMFFLGFFRNANELGLYAAAQKPVQILYILPSLISASIFPIINRLAHENNFAKVKSIIESSIVAVVVIGLPIVIGGIILAKPLILLLFGNEYVNSTLSFQLLLSTIFFVFPGTIIGNTLFSLQMERKILKASAFGAIVNVAFDLLFIPLFGIVGSAIATIFSQITTNGLTWKMLYARIEFHVFKKLVRMFVAVITMGIVAYILSLTGIHVLISVAISAIIYFAMLFALKDPFALSIFAMRKNIS